MTRLNVLNDLTELEKTKRYEEEDDKDGLASFGCCCCCWGKVLESGSRTSRPILEFKTRLYEADIVGDPAHDDQVHERPDALLNDCYRCC
jgi:hypothetical protein